MTAIKPRHPISWAGACTKILGTLGLSAGTAIGRSDALIRRFADPDLDNEPNLSQALALDAAFVNATGESAPILKVYKVRLRELTEGAAHEARAPLVALADAMSEVGDVSRAVLVAVADGKVAQHERIAVQREIAEAIEKLSRLARDLDAGAGA